MKNSRKIVFLPSSLSSSYDELRWKFERISHFVRIENILPFNWKNFEIKFGYNIHYSCHSSVDGGSLIRTIWLINKSEIRRETVKITSFKSQQSHFHHAALLISLTSHYQVFNPFETENDNYSEKPQKHFEMPFSSIQSIRKENENFSI